MKVKVGVYNFTCCEGCTIVLVESFNKKFEEYNKKIEFVDFRTLKPFKEVHETDIAFVEGAISTESEVRKIKEIRSKTKKLVALGSGAVSGFPSDQRNNFSLAKKKQIEPILKQFKQIDKVSPLKKFVKVDDEINGCPVSEADLTKKLEGYLKNA
jgi:coenzyme F420-reducing hydrogenase gamma subunit